jgi:hypothetical protein
VHYVSRRKITQKNVKKSFETSMDSKKRREGADCPHLRPRILLFDPKLPKRNGSGLP